MRPTFFFDYIFYRVNDFYFKWDGKGTSTAIAAVSMVQSFMIADIIGFTLRILFDRDQTAPYAKAIALTWATLTFGIFIWNYVKFNDKYEQLKDYWKNESLNQSRLKGLLVILSIVLPWIPLILIGVYW
jgi:hypothetical protein